ARSRVRRDAAGLRRPAGTPLCTCAPVAGCFAGAADYLLAFPAWLRAADAWRGGAQGRVVHRASRRPWIFLRARKERRTEPCSRHRPSWARRADADPRGFLPLFALGAGVRPDRAGLP